MNKIKKNYFELLLLLFSMGIPFALGTTETVGGMLASFLIFWLLWYLSYGVFFVFFSLVMLTCALLLPASIWFGEPTITMIGAFIETDFQEANEFIHSLPAYAYMLSLATLLFGGYILYLGRKKERIYNKKRNLIAITMAIVSIVITIERPIRKIKEVQKFEWQHSHTLIISFYASLYTDVMSYYEFHKNLKMNLDNPTTWQITSVTPKYQNYVLVIGESMRSDYMSLYGFPLENCSFLKEVKGTVLEGFTSTAPNTTASLLRMFIQMKGEDFVYENNLISLAKKAGYDTYWLSNQGGVGEFDTPVFKIGYLADNKKFMKKGGYDSKLVYDSALLPVFKEYLSAPATRPRLFILHLVGSHPLFQKRLEQPIHYHYYNESISAYIQTIEQTDNLLKQVYNILQERGMPFSLIYFSDHGLETKDKGTDKATLAHGVCKASYRVPFVQINSDDTIHKKTKVKKSAFHFLDGYAQWLGIKEKSLKNNYDFLSSKPDTLKVYTGKYILFDTLQEDKVLDSK